MIFFLYIYILNHEKYLTKLKTIFSHQVLLLDYTSSLFFMHWKGKILFLFHCSCLKDLIVIKQKKIGGINNIQNKKTLFFN